jgi:hypothetical protein
VGDTVKRRGHWWVEASDGTWMRWTGDRWEPRPSPAPPPGRGDHLLDWSKALGLPAFILAVTTLAVTIRPSWIAPNERAVIIKDTSITQGVEFREYVHYPGVEPFLVQLDPVTVESADRGVVVDFNYELRGFSRDDILPFRWTLLNSDGERVSESEEVDRLFRSIPGLGFYACVSSSARSRRRHPCPSRSKCASTSLSLAAGVPSASG